MPPHCHGYQASSDLVPLCSLSPPTITLLPSPAAGLLSAPSPCGPLHGYCLCLDGPSSNSSNYSSFSKIQAPPLLLSHLILRIVPHTPSPGLFISFLEKTAVCDRIIYYCFSSLLESDSDQVQGPELSLEPPQGWFSDSMKVDPVLRLLHVSSSQRTQD